jgi:hypothetical protein
MRNWTTKRLCCENYRSSDGGLRHYHATQRRDQGDGQQEGCQGGQAPAMS